MASAVLLASLGTPVAHSEPPTEQTIAGRPLTNLAHLNFLGDTVTPPEQAGHSTYRHAEDPELGVLWTYADKRDGGTYEPVGGGPYDEATDTWGQGAFNADDLTRAAVVYVRHWASTGDADSRDRAYQLLRTVTYMQTTTGDDAGNVVLWMQPDGTLNPSAEPVELPDPSDSDESYWLARTVWALGEGYEAFAADNPDFAAFLEARLGLALDALERASLSHYGQWEVADGIRVPAWLITDAADATSEAVLGLAAYVRSAPSDSTVADRAVLALERYAEAIAAMSAGDAGNWPFGAVVQWTHSRSMWHAWASQMPAALGLAADALDSPSPGLLGAALTDSAVFTPYLLTSTGPINGWQPAPTDLTQIAYGVDSRLQSLLTLADVAGRSGLESLAAMTASWYFGANRAGTPMYDPATGVTFDGLQADGEVNQNAGAESTMHGLLSMLALDAHPNVAEAARTLNTLVSQDGVTVVEAESGVLAGGAATVTPDDAWTGESAWSGGAYLELPDGASASWEVAASDQPRLVLPVVDLVDAPSVAMEWSSGEDALGGVDVEAGGEQGITEAPGSLRPVTLPDALPAGATEFSVMTSGEGASAKVDAVLLIPVVSRLILSGDGHETVLLHNATHEERTGSVAQSVAHTVTWRAYDSSGKLAAEGAGLSVPLQPQGFAIVETAPSPTPTPAPSHGPSGTPSAQPSSSPSRTTPPTAPATQRPQLPSTGN